MGALSFTSLMRWHWTHGSGLFGSLSLWWHLIQSILVFSVWVTWEKLTGGSLPPSICKDMGSGAFFCAETMLNPAINAKIKAIAMIKNALFRIWHPLYFGYVIIKKAFKSRDSTNALTKALRTFSCFGALKKRV